MFGQLTARKLLKASFADVRLLRGEDQRWVSKEIYQHATSSNKMDRRSMGMGEIKELKELKRSNGLERLVTVWTSTRLILLLLSFFFFCLPCLFFLINQKKKRNKLRDRDLPRRLSAMNGFGSEQWVNHQTISTIPIRNKKWDRMPRLDERKKRWLTGFLEGRLALRDWDGQSFFVLCESTQRVEGRVILGKGGRSDRV